MVDEVQRRDVRRLVEQEMAAQSGRRRSKPEKENNVRATKPKHNNFHRLIVTCAEVKPPWTRIAAAWRPGPYYRSKPAFKVTTEPLKDWHDDRSTKGAKSYFLALALAL
jgi:hypothetical protein